jgi:hypothetical protein
MFYNFLVTHWSWLRPVITSNRFGRLEKVHLRTGGEFLTRVALSVKVRVKGGNSERNMC